ncbi:MAG: DNA polymerase III subunit delta' [Parasporobacterium sp.]|nr:DNA polymerase III subunit delta' [Parasporobacterium sp.]
MSVQKGILGNQNNIRHMKEAAEKGRLPHAYILTGPEGSGKKTFAGYMASALLCEEGVRNGPCGICPSCIKAKTHNHPDIIWTFHEKPTVLSVSEIRDQVVSTIYTAPYYGPYKIYIITDAQLLNEHGQNALLKTMEEPPEYVLIFLLTDNADALLDTIRSRCIRLDMESLDSKTIEEALIKDGALPEEAAACASFSRGNLGCAKELAEGGPFRELRDETVKTLKNLKNLDALEIFQKSAELDKVSGRKVLDMILKWYRDVLILKAGEGEWPLYYGNDRSVIRSQAEIISYEGLEKIICQTEESRKRLLAGVKPEAVFETLFLQIREEYR